MLEALGDANAAAVVGLFGGILLGLAARMGRFCTLGAIEDVLYAQNDTRIRIWIAAIGFAIIGSYTLLGLGLFDPAQSFYMNREWSAVASIFGGLLFGYGMAMAGNCGFTALARLGGGDLRSFVIVVVMGLAAYATLAGPFAWARVVLFPPGELTTEATGIAHYLGNATGVPVALIGLLIGAAFVAYAFANPKFRTSRANMLWPLVIAAAVVSAWAGTAYINRTGFDEINVVSHTFSVPIGETMLYGMTASGQSLSFGIGSVVGVWLGAFIGSLIKGHFRWEACEDPRELRRQIFGATMMGVGAVVALGWAIIAALKQFRHYEPQGLFPCGGIPSCTTCPARTPCVSASRLT